MSEVGGYQGPARFSLEEEEDALWIAKEDGQVGGFEIHPEEYHDDWGHPTEGYARRGRGGRTLQRLWPGSWVREDGALVLTGHREDGSPLAWPISLDVIGQWSEVVLTLLQDRLRRDLDARSARYLHYRQHLHTYRYRGGREPVCCITLDVEVAPLPPRGGMELDLLRAEHYQLTLDPGAVARILQASQTHGLDPGTLPELGLWDTELDYQHGRIWLTLYDQDDENDEELLLASYPLEEDNLLEILRLCHATSGEV